MVRAMEQAVARPAVLPAVQEKTVDAILLAVQAVGLQVVLQMVQEVVHMVRRLPVVQEAVRPSVLRVVQKEAV